MADPSRLVHFQRFQTALRAARCEPGLTRQAVAAALDWPIMKLIEIEIAYVNVSNEDLRTLINYYGNGNDVLLAELTSLADSVQSQTWPTEHSGIVPAGLLDLIAFENSADIVKSFEPLLVPGLLQTEEYARLVIMQYLPELSEEETDSLVNLRISRQGLLGHQNSPQFQFILDEAVIQRLADGASTMRNQLRRLVDISNQPNLTIEIVPFSAGLHEGLKGSFVLLEIEEPPYDDVLYIEGASGNGTISRAPSDEVLSRHKTFESIAQLTVGAEESVAYMQRHLNDSVS